MKILILILFVFFNSCLSFAVTLKTVFQEKSAPKYIENSKNKGICFEIIHAINKELQNENIYIEENSPFMPLKRIKYELLEGKINVFFCMAKNKKREKDYTFINIPLYELNGSFAKLKSNNFEFNGIESLKGKTIATISGSRTEKTIMDIEGVTVDSSPNIISAIKKVSAGYTDLLYYHNLGILYNLKNMNINNVEIVDKPFYTYFHYIAFSKYTNPLYIILTEAALIKLIKDKTIERILNKYLH
jgi:polar amino acid transport system substrate-binding protein